MSKIWKSRLAEIVKDRKMTLNEFIQRFDKDNSIVLLEGKRTVLDTDKEKLDIVPNLVEI